MAGKPRRNAFTYPQLFFRQPWEWFSRYRATNTHIVWAFYGTIIAGALWYAHVKLQVPLWQMGILFIAGAFTWTFMEYLLHRFVLHYVEDSPWIQRWHNFIHGAHHDVPNDLRFVTASPFVTFPIAVLLWALFYLVLGWNWVWPFFAGFGLGYLLYEYTHYAIHKYPQPPHPLLKGLWQNHYLHHYRTPEKRFGVTTTLWDRVFGTYEKA